MIGKNADDSTVHGEEANVIDWGAARAAVEVISGKWTLAVLSKLAEGTKGFNELAAATGMENKALERTLRNLEGAHLVVRQVWTTRSRLRARYCLTPQARSLMVPLDQLARWWRAVSDQVED